MKTQQKNRLLNVYRTARLAIAVASTLSILSCSLFGSLEDIRREEEVAYIARGLLFGIDMGSIRASDAAALLDATTDRYLSGDPENFLAHETLFSEARPASLDAYTPFPTPAWSVSETEYTANTSLTITASQAVSDIVVTFSETLATNVQGISFAFNDSPLDEILVQEGELENAFVQISTWEGARGYVGTGTLTISHEFTSPDVISGSLNGTITLTGGRVSEIESDLVYSLSGAISSDFPTYQGESGSVKATYADGTVIEVDIFSQ